jgi:ribosomal protein L23
VQSQSNEQKGHQTTRKNSHKWKNIYVLPFKTMAIMASCCFFIHMNVRNSKQKIHQIFNLSFDLKPLKVNIFTLEKIKFAKDYPKNSYNEQKLMGF